MKILIVDDSKLSRLTILKRMPAAIKESADIMQGTNGIEAVELYKKHQPDIVFLDLTMPEMDGFEALGHIRDFDKNSRVYIVTADVQTKAREKVMSLGATGVEAKPIAEERLADIFAMMPQGKP